MFLLTFLSKDEISRQFLINLDIHFSEVRLLDTVLVHFSLFKLNLLSSHYDKFSLFPLSFGNKPFCPFVVNSKATVIHFLDVSEKNSVGAW